MGNERQNTAKSLRLTDIGYKRLQPKLSELSTDCAGEALYTKIANKSQDEARTNGGYKVSHNTVRNILTGSHAVNHAGLINLFVVFGATIDPSCYEPFPTEARDTKKLNSLPFPRNMFFTGREQELKTLRANLTESHVAGVSGSGGVGKSQLAIEYTYRFGEEYDVVFWVQAETEAAMRTGRHVNFCCRMLLS